MLSAATKVVIVLALIKRVSSAETPPPTAPPQGTTRQCLSCASEILQSEWSATGYPVQPSVSDTFTYSSDCMNTITNVATTGCNTMCVEALYVVSEFYGPSDL